MGKMSRYRFIRQLRTWFSRAHQGAKGRTNDNLKEVIEMLLEDGTPRMESEFVGTQSVVIS